jgi:hypothetical protein
MTTHDEYAARYQQEWVPKDAPESTVPVATSPRRRGDVFKTSDRPRVDIVPCTPNVRQHAIVLFSDGDRTIRQRALDEIKRLMEESDSNGALEVLAQFEEWKNQD